MRMTCIGLAVATTLAATTVAAQPADSNIPIFSALMATPVGAIPPNFHSLADSGSFAPRMMATRYSAWSLPDNARNDIVAASAYAFSRDGQAMSATVGYFRPGCECDGVLMLGADFVATARSRRIRPDLLAELLFAGGLGYGHDALKNYFSGSFSVPIGLSLIRPGGHRLSAFVEPRTALGIEGGPWSMARVIGGGFAWSGRRGRGVQLALNRVLLDQSVTNLGVAMTWSLK